MIAPMEKLVLAGPKGRAKELLQSLQQAGVVHLETLRPEALSAYQLSPEERAELETRLNALLEEFQSRPRRPGAERTATNHDIATITTVISSDCHRKIVCVNGITPVIASNSFDMLAALAWNCAAVDDRPSAQTAPRPR